MSSCNCANKNLYGGTRLLERGISIDTSYGFNTNDALSVSHSAIRGKSNPAPAVQFSTATGAINFTKSGNTVGDLLVAPRLKGTTVAVIPRKSKFFALAANVPVQGNSTGPVYMVPSFDTNGFGGAPAGNVDPALPLTSAGSGLGLRGAGLSSEMNPPLANGILSDKLISYDQIRAKTGSLMLGAYNGSPTVFDGNVGFDLHAATVQNGGPGLNYTVSKGNIITSISEASSGLIGESINKTNPPGCARESGTCWALLNDNVGAKVNLNQNPDSTFAGLSPLRTPPGQVVVDYNLVAITINTDPYQSSAIGMAVSGKTAITTAFRVEELEITAVAGGFIAGQVYPTIPNSFLPSTDRPSGVGLSILVTSVDGAGIITSFSIKDQGYGYVIGETAIFVSSSGIIQEARIAGVTNSESLRPGQKSELFSQLSSDDTVEPEPKYTAEGELRARQGQANGPTPNNPYGTPAIVTGYASVASGPQPQGQPVQPAAGVGPGVATPIFTISAGNGNLSHSLKVQNDINTSYLINNGLSI